MAISKENKVQETAARSVLSVCELAKSAATKIARLADRQRSEALLSIAAEIEKRQSELLNANKKDMENARRLLKENQLTQALADRLKLDEGKLASVICGIRQIAKMPDPLGKVELARELDGGLELYRLTCPIGLIGVIFEARPDVLPQIAALCLKSGNAVILKGGSEAEHSNRALFNCLQHAASSSGIPFEALVLLESRADVNELLKADRYVDLLIPRGSNELVAFIQENTRIPVLGHAQGVCHIYVDKSADVDKAINIIIDAKTQYPAACNAVETVLVHRQIAATLLPELSRQLSERGVKLRFANEAIALLSKDVRVEPATDDDWRTEYGDLTVSLKLVDTISDAVEHINRYGSAHTEAMIGEDESLFEEFFLQVNSANVFWNASTRFADGFRYGFGAEVGISTGKLHPRGPVGIDGLVTYKYKLKGKNHIVADYVGSNAKSFTHRNLQPKEKRENP